MAEAEVVRPPWADKVEWALEDQRRTKTWLAGEVGVTRETFSRWLAGTPPYRANDDQIRRMAEALGLDPADLGLETHPIEPPAGERREDRGGEERNKGRTGSGSGGGENGGGDGLPPDLHPFIHGLLQTLPEPGSRWPADKRRQWIQAAENIFALIYEDGDSGV